jgi:transcriptional regulator with XRE-family HTH domain
MTIRILSGNLRTLMKASETLSTQRKLGLASGIDQRTVGRILNGEHSPQLKQIEAIAQAFDLMPWQLLIPNLDPKNPPVCETTVAEKELYSKLRDLAKQLPDV